MNKTVDVQKTKAFSLIQSQLSYCFHQILETCFEASSSSSESCSSKDMSWKMKSQQILTTFKPVLYAVLSQRNQEEDPSTSELKHYKDIYGRFCRGYNCTQNKLVFYSRFTRVSLSGSAQEEVLSVWRAPHVA